MRWNAVLLAGLLILGACTTPRPKDNRDLVIKPEYARAYRSLRSELMRAAKINMPIWVDWRGTCKQVDFVDAATVTPYDSTTGQWTEVWTFQVCETTATVPIQFERYGYDAIIAIFISAGVRVVDAPGS